MKEIQTLKELLYLGVGAASLAVHKVDDYLDHLIEDNHMTREEGHRVITNIKEKMLEMKIEVDKEKDKLVENFATKFNQSKQDLSNLINGIIEQPDVAKEKFSQQIESLKIAVTEKTNLSKDEAQHLIDRFIEEVKLLKLSLKDRAEVILFEAQNNLGEYKQNASKYFQIIEEKSRGLTYDFIDKMRVSLAKLQERFEPENQKLES